MRATRPPSPAGNAHGSSGSDSGVRGRIPWFPVRLPRRPPLAGGDSRDCYSVTRGGTRAYELTLQELDRAISLLAPAEACSDFTHPNLAAWREVRQEAESLTDPRPVAVFDADPVSETDEIAVIALRRAGERGVR